MNYALWQHFERSGSYDGSRFENLLETIRDWDLFLMFFILDGSTKGQERSRLLWFIREVSKYKGTCVDESSSPNLC